MAKPRRHVPHTIYEPDSRFISSSSFPSPSPSSSIPTPSIALLSALACIAAAPLTVQGSPVPLPTVPPDFLCPSIAHDHPSRVPFPSATSSTVNSLRSVKRLADKYVQDMDDRWHKTDLWTLFGTTCCTSTPLYDYPPSSATTSTQTLSPTPTSLLTPTTLPSGTPATLTSPSAATTSITGGYLSAMELDVSALPAGWKTSSTSSSTKSTIILVIAIFIAGFLCTLMFGCVFWQRKRRKARTKVVDADTEERRRRHTLGEDDDSEGEMDEREREARGRMRTWARATARWKANVRLSARRRRKKVSARGCRPISPVRGDGEALAAGSLPASLPRLLDQEENAAMASMPTSTPAPESRTASGVLLPPTYKPSTPPPGSVASGLAYSVQHLHTPEGEGSEEPAPYVPPQTGHVAIDDKAHLGRLCELASAPPPPPPPLPSEPGIVPVGEAEPRVSAPEWESVVAGELAWFSYSESEPEPYSSQFPPAFPSPPAKVRVLEESYLDGETYSSPDDGSAGPMEGEARVEDGWLAASAPPVDPDASGTCVEPSAPSLPTLEDADGAVVVVDGNDIEQGRHPVDGSQQISRMQWVRRAAVVSDGARSLGDEVVDEAYGTLPSYHP